MSVLTLVPKYARIGEGFTRREVADSYVHPGRRTDGTQSAATWVTQLVDLRKPILLCSFCRGYFSPKANRYRRMFSPDHTVKTDGYQANGQCDGCKTQTINTPGGGTAFIAEEVYNLVNVDPAEARRQARINARAAWASDRFTWWQRVTSLVGNR